MANREMKDSEIEWVGEIPNDWDVKLAKRIFKREKREIFNQEIVTAFRDGEVTQRRKRRSEGFTIATKEIGYQGVKKGDLVIHSMDAFAGAIGVSDSDGKSTPVYLVCSPKIDTDNQYYAYLLRAYSNVGYIESMAKGIRERSTDFRFSTFSITPLIYPSLIEQQKIAAFLDGKVAHINNIIEDTKKSIESLKSYKQSLITETVTKGLNPKVDMKDSGIDWIGKIPKHWISSRIKYVTNISRGQFSHRPRNDERYYDGQYPFIQTGDVARAKKYITTYSQTLNELGKSVSKEFPKGTLVMNIAANVGDVAILDFDSYFPDSVVGFVPKEKYHWNYLYYTFTGMKSMFVRTAISNTQLNLNVERIKDMHVPVTTDYNEQLKIAEFLDKKVSNIDSLLEKKGEVITELESYKKSIIYEYVTGKKEVK